MHTIAPARLKPGVSLDSLPDPASETAVQGDAVITGRALIIWDPMSMPGTRLARKLDAIDTDQITPAADCVSESLETLDERWKAGSFRYLMPDFRARVHRGETFVIAGDRFAIGSSREMSPAGLKGVAEEAGLELVIVCGNNMGDIFRRNSFNLGLHVVQSPEAVADARDGDAFTFDPGVARARATRRRAGPTTRCRCRPRKTRSGAAAASSPSAAASCAPSVRTAAGDRLAGRRRRARGMTTTEQIVWAHRVDKGSRPRR